MYFFCRLSEVFQQVQSFVMTFSTEIVCIYITSGGKPIDWDEVNQTTNRFLGSVLVTTDMTDMSIGKANIYTRSTVNEM